MQNKHCTKCNTSLSIEMFSLKSSGKYGRCSICKTCEKIKHKEYYEKNKETILTKMKISNKLNPKIRRKLSEEEKQAQNEKRRESRKISPESSLWSQAKKRAKKKGIEFSIDIDDIIVTKLCPILWIPLHVGDGKLTVNSPSLDRVDNNRGYVKGNIMVVSHLANTMKSSATKEQLLRFADYIYEFFEKEKQ